MSAMQFLACFLAIIAYQMICTMILQAKLQRILSILLAATPVPEEKKP